MNSDFEAQYEAARYWFAIFLIFFAVSFSVVAGVNAGVKPDMQGDSEIQLKVHSEYVAEIAEVDLFNDCDIDRPPPTPMLFEKMINCLFILIWANLQLLIGKKQKRNPFSKLRSNTVHSVSDIVSEKILFDEFLKLNLKSYLIIFQNILILLTYYLLFKLFFADLLTKSFENINKIHWAWMKTILILFFSL